MYTFIQKIADMPVQNKIILVFDEDIGSVLTKACEQDNLILRALLKLCATTYLKLSLLLDHLKKRAANRSQCHTP